MTQLDIRAMSLDDLDAVLEIERQAQFSSWSAALFASCLDQRHVAWVLRVDSELAGYAVAESVLDESTLLTIAIAPALQRRGYARYLLTELIADYRRRGVTTMFLEVRRSNICAQHLYRQLGFIEVGSRRNYYVTESGREDALVMRYDDA